MKLLLDTHVFAWAIGQPKRLGRRAARAIRDKRNEVWLSPMSILELAHVARKGRLRYSGSFDDWIGRSLSALECKQAPMTFEVALETRGVTLAHHEPGDRVIAATARVYGLTLVTADEALLAARNVETMTAD